MYCVACQFAVTLDSSVASTVIMQGSVLVIIVAVYILVLGDAGSITKHTDNYAVKSVFKL